MLHSHIFIIISLWHSSAKQASLNASHYVPSLASHIQFLPAILRKSLLCLVHGHYTLRLTRRSLHSKREPRTVIGYVANILQLHFVF